MQQITVCRVYQPFSACIITWESQRDDAPSWTSVNVKDKWLFRLKSGSFNMMENTFSVAVRPNICPVCKSAWRLEPEPCRLHKRLMTQPRCVFVQICSDNFSHKVAMWRLWTVDEDLERFVARRKPQSVFVPACFWVFYWLIIIHDWQQLSALKAAFSAACIWLLIQIIQ